MSWVPLLACPAVPLRKTVLDKPAVAPGVEATSEPKFCTYEFAESAQADGGRS